MVVRDFDLSGGIGFQIVRERRHWLSRQGQLDTTVHLHGQAGRWLRLIVLRKRPGQDPGVRVRKYRACTEHVVSKAGQCSQVRDSECKRRATSHQRVGMVQRQQENLELVGGDQVGEALHRPRPGDPRAGFRQVLLEERLDSFGLGIALGVCPRRADHEVALAIDLPLPVGGMGPRRDGSEDAGEKGSEERPPGGARSSGANGLSSCTCRRRQGSGPR